MRGYGGINDHIHILFLSLCLPAAHACRGMGDYRAHFGASDRLHCWPYKGLEEERTSHTVQPHTTFRNPGPQHPQKAGVYFQGPPTARVPTLRECVDCTDASRVAECLEDYMESLSHFRIYSRFWEAPFNVLTGWSETNCFGPTAGI